MFSVFDIFKVSIGPSSSHTMGPMIAAKHFRDLLIDKKYNQKIDSINITFLGSLAFTGLAHGSDKGIILCGSGIGISIAANKIKGIRAALCLTTEYAKISRKHNDSNILALGARFVDIDNLKSIVDVWFKTKFEGGRHLTRINKIELT